MMRDGFIEVQLTMFPLLDALEDLEFHKEAAKKYARAQRVLKKNIPPVSTPTRFLVGEDWAIEVTPEDRDGFAVKDMVVQRKSIKRLEERGGKTTTD